VVGLYDFTARGHENFATTIIMPIGMSKTNCKMSRSNVQNNDNLSFKKSATTANLLPELLGDNISWAFQETATFT
jgi:hypothetical protein